MQDEHPWQAQQTEDPRIEAEAGGVDELEDAPAEGRRGSTRWIALFFAGHFCADPAAGGLGAVSTPGRPPRRADPYAGWARWVGSFLTKNH